RAHYLVDLQVPGGYTVASGRLDRRSGRTKLAAFADEASHCDGRISNFGGFRDCDVRTPRVERSNQPRAVQISILALVPSIMGFLHIPAKTIIPDSGNQSCRSI